MKKLIWIFSLAALAAFGGGKDTSGNAITENTLLGNVDGEQTKVGDINALKVETDPTVPSWAKETEKPRYTAGEVGARPNDWMPSAVDVGAATPGAVTNIAGVVTSNVVTKGYVEGLGIKSVDTNGVNALIRSYDTTNLVARFGEKQSVTNLITFWEQDEDDEYGVGSTNKYPSTRMLYGYMKDRRMYTDLTCLTNGSMVASEWESIDDVYNSFYGITWRTAAIVGNSGFALHSELMDAEDTPIQALWENAIAYIAIPSGGDFLYMAFGMEDEKCAIKFVYTVNGGSVYDVLSVDAGTAVSSFYFPARAVSRTTYYFMGEDSLAKVSQIPQVEGKRDLTNNVCYKTSATFGAWAKDNLPSGVTWNDQPTYDASIDLWEWGYNGGSAQSEEGGADATSLTFGYGEGFTSTRTATPVALSNDVFTTYSFVTNAVASAGGGSGGGVSTNAVSGIITNHVTSGYLCSVAAASAMTNGVLEVEESAGPPYWIVCGRVLTGNNIQYQTSTSINVKILDIEQNIGYIRTTLLPDKANVSDVYTQAQADARYATPSSVATNIHAYAVDDTYVTSATMVWTNKPVTVSLSGTLAASGTWPETKAVYLHIVPSGTYTVSDTIRLLGYATWPTTAFDAVAWRVGPYYYINILFASQE